MGDNYYTQKYSFNPKIREMIERTTGKRYGLSNVEIENILASALEGKATKELNLSDDEKMKVFANINDINPTDYKLEELSNFYNFLSLNLTQDERISYITSVYNRKCKLGKVYDNAVRINNSCMSDFIGLFSNDVTILKGIGINTIFVADVKKFGIEPTYNEETWEITDLGYKNGLIEVLRKISSVNNMKIAFKDEIVIIATEDSDYEKIFETNFKDIQVYNILGCAYEWEVD